MPAKRTTHNARKSRSATNAQPELLIVIDPSQTAFAAGGAAKRIVRRAADALTELGSALREAGTQFVDTVKTAGPDEISLELNLCLETEGKWLIIAGKAGATASVTMTWRR